MSYENDNSVLELILNLLLLPVVVVSTILTIHTIIFKRELFFNALSDLSQVIPSIDFFMVLADIFTQFGAQVGDSWPFGPLISASIVYLVIFILGFLADEFISDFLELVWGLAILPIGLLWILIFYATVGIFGLLAFLFVYALAIFITNEIFMLF
ncbi:MAG: hypothetical protein K8S27_05075 [Candidatus Omnitrophica bacterium]|nr:hypothetical protein [Candidatus Omnitrophota bacterium]